ncbi:S8 family peptidase [candidate division KSB1 bacterium]|nr:S8 family peptidase [candidate division KSB1 bacterium]
MKTPILQRNLQISLLALASSLCAICVFAQSTSQISPLDFRFHFLHENASLAKQSATALPATIRFHHPPSNQLLNKIEQLGGKFHRHNGKRLGSTTVFPVELSHDLLPALEQIPEIASIQPCWRPVRVPPLDVSRPQIQAEAAWKLKDKQGRSLTGKGVLIADFDTGADFFHPMLWFADGDTVNWIDVNGNLNFDPGVDAVDKNRNGSVNSGEILRYKEVPYSGNTAGVYDADLDFLYNDVNNNNARDLGLAAGFTEASPTYGEQWFIALDTNHDNRLNTGERLVGLKTSKIRAILEVDGTVRRRGVDLINASPDNGPFGGHGTSVAGIAIGGVAGVHRLAGIAPDAEMIFGSISYNNSPRFFTTLPGMMAWAEAEGADIMLYEDGEWVWEYLDGSSNEETMINEMAAKGIVQVTPAGNLTGGAMQKTSVVNANDSTTITFTEGGSSEVWPSLRWQGNMNDVVVKFQIDAGSFVTLPANGSTITIGGKAVYSNKSISSRGTVMLIVYIAASGGATYNLRIINKTSAQKQVEGMLGDNGFNWIGLAQWNPPSESNTVTWPATADSAIGVAAYRNKSIDTNINGFSGRGLRIDNRRQVDVASPGSTVFSIGRNDRYVAFGGTSSAGPHVAGAVALILQADPTLSHGKVRALLRAGAISDGFTGAVPNTTWGFGKLRIENSLRQIITAVATNEIVPQSWHLAQNFPNPVLSAAKSRSTGNPTTHIVFRVPHGEHVSLKLYDVQGREVATLVDEVKMPGTYNIIWDASGFASGVYFYRLSGATFSATKKLLLVR